MTRLEEKRFTITVAGNPVVTKIGRMTPRADEAQAKIKHVFEEKFGVIKPIGTVKLTIDAVAALPGRHGRRHADRFIQNRRSICDIGSVDGIIRTVLRALLGVAYDDMSIVEEVTCSKRCGTVAVTMITLTATVEVNDDDSRV